MHSMPWPADFEKRLIQNFSKHVETYDRHAQLQKNMAERLATLLPASMPSHILEIGCGTGLFTRHLLARNPEHLIVNDIAQAMVDHLKTQLNLPSSTEFHAGNAESSYFPEGQDLICANAVFQWFRSPRDTVKKLSGILNSQGRLIFSTFGPRTLEEFREAGSLQGPTPLLSEKDWIEILDEAGFQPEQVVTEEREIFFPGTVDLLKNLQQIGAAPFRMLGPGGLKKLIRDYDRLYMTPQGVYTHWELTYLAANLK